MHLLKNSLFQDQIVACGNERNCYIRNDGFHSICAIVSFESWKAGSSESEKTNNTYTYSAMVDASTIHWFDLPSTLTQNADDIILIRLSQQEEVHLSRTGIVSADLSESVYLQAMPKDIVGLQQPTKIEILSIHYQHQHMDHGQPSTATIELRSDRLAVFVVLTTRAQGRFTDNCFTLRPMEKKVR
jgi:hypothetical protein